MVIKHFVPSIIYSSPTFRATVLELDASDPASGSVKQNAQYPLQGAFLLTLSPVRYSAYNFFYDSFPCCKIGFSPNPDAATAVAKPASTLASSSYTATTV